MNNPFEMVVAIIAIVMIASVLKARYKRNESDTGDEIRPDPDTARLRDEVRQLKERIAVLERVITDNNSAITLDREIEKLR